jgi:putative transposase
VLAGLPRLLPRQRLGRFFARPETLLRWRPDLAAKRWSYPHTRPGRPTIPNETTVLALRSAKNPTSGYSRTHGELATTDGATTPSNARAVPNRYIVDPSPSRSGPTWTQFLATQAKALMACDSFHVDTILLRRLYVRVCIHHDTRLAPIAGITSNPDTG